MLRSRKSVAPGEDQSFPEAAEEVQPPNASLAPGTDRERRSGDEDLWWEEESRYPLLQGIGRVFITVGLLVLSFLGYQLWGTNAVTAQTQGDLRRQLQEVAPSGAAPSTASPPKTGAGIGTIQIPKIGVDRVIVEGVDDESLKKGPGHYPDTAFPGEAGNVVLSGHRTTYGAPFYRLDELSPGDEIRVGDASGTYTYKVTEKKIVLPTDLSVVVPSTDARLTLTTCHPRFSARQRLIIVAALQGDPR